MTDPDLALFAHVVSRPEPDLNLAQAALLIAEQEYPGLDVAGYLERLDALGAEAKTCLETLALPKDRSGGDVVLARLERVVKLVFVDHGFCGNHTDYYDPRNSYLNEVLERKVGIPITLALIFTEVCAHAGIEARGVSYPNHFLVRVPGPKRPLFVDPFAGALMSAEDLRALNARTTGESRDPDPRLLEPATKREILIRMLNNLRGVHSARDDRARLSGVLRRIEVLSPSDDLRAQIEACDGKPAEATAKRSFLN